MIDYVKGDVLVDAQWLQDYFRQHEALIRKYNNLFDKHSMLKAMSDSNEVIRLDVTA